MGFTVSEMITVKEIEDAIAELPHNDFWSLTDRLIAMRDAAWDRQMQEDSKLGGPLDRMAEKALSEYAAGRTRRLS